MRALGGDEPSLDERMARIDELQEFVADLEIALSGLGVEVELILGDDPERAADRQEARPSAA
jgi:hypothetical protein